MFNWGKRKNTATTISKAVGIGDGNLVVDLPAHYTTEQEDNTTVVYDQASENAVIRFSTIYISNDQHPGVQDPGIQSIRKTAAQSHKHVTKHNDISYFAYAEPTQEENSNDLIYYWIVGYGNYVVIVSCWTSNAIKQDAIGTAVLKSVEPAVFSLRSSQIQRWVANNPEKQTISILTSEHEQQLSLWRQSIFDLARSTPIKPHFTGGVSDLDVIQALLDHESFDKTNTYIQEGLGIIFGDMLTRKLGLHWVTITVGSDTLPALQYQNTGIVLYPRDMIVRRIEQGESVNITYLYNVLVEQVGQLTAQDSCKTANQ